MGFNSVFKGLMAPFDNQSTAFVGLLCHWGIFTIMQWISECNLLLSDVTQYLWGRVLQSADGHYFFHS